MKTTFSTVPSTLVTLLKTLLEAGFHKHSHSWSSSPLKSALVKLPYDIDHHGCDAFCINYCSESKVPRHHSWPFRLHLKHLERKKHCFSDCKKKPFTEDFMEENIYKFKRWFIPPTLHTNFSIG